MHEVLIYGNIKCGFLQILVGLCGFKRARHLTKQENQMNEHEESNSFHPDEDDVLDQFAAIPNNLLRDSSISPRCRWFICYLLSHSGRWHISIPYVRENQKVSKDVMYKIIDEAIESGYVKRESWLDKGLKKYKYFVSRKPKFKKCFLCPENPDTENKDTIEEQLLENTNSSSYEEHISKENIYKKEKSSFFSSGKVKMEKSRYDKLVLEFGQSKIDDMVRRLDEYGNMKAKEFKKYTCHDSVIRNWIRKDGECKPLIATDDTKEFVKKIFLRFKNEIDRNEIIIGRGYIEFPYIKGEQMIVKANESGFKERVLNNLRKMNRDVRGL